MSSSPVAIWRNFVSWLRTILFSRQDLLTGGTQSSASLEKVFGSVESLDIEILEELEKLADYHPGVVTTTVRSALADYRDLHTLLEGPAKQDIVDDVSILGETEAALTALIVRAQEVAVLAKVAGTREADSEARQAAGDAMLELQDRQRILGSLTSSALQWASSRSREDLEEYRRCATRVGNGQ